MKTEFKEFRIKSTFITQTLDPWDGKYLRDMYRITIKNTLSGKSARFNYWTGEGVKMNKEYLLYIFFAILEDTEYADPERFSRIASGNFKRDLKTFQECKKTLRKLKRVIGSEEEIEKLANNLRAMNL